MIFAFFIVLLAAFIRAICGFGYALLSTPLLTFIFDVKSVVVMNVVLSTASCMLALVYMRRHIDFRRTLFISLGSIPGLLLGTYLLATLDPSIIKLAIAVIVIPFSVLLLLGHSHQFKRDTLSCGVAGFVSGVFLASTSLGGPPVVLLLLNQGLTKERFVATIAVFFIFTGAILTGTFTSLGMITVDLLIKIAILLPALWLGFYTGMKVLFRINPVLFKKFASGIVLIAAVLTIVSVVTGG